MITDVDNRAQIGPNLRPEVLPPYWSQYFEYERTGSDLHAVVESRLSREVLAARESPRPFMDSKQVISRVLTALGPTHTFHRQFSERFPDFKREQVLGMQLYALVARDDATWMYHRTHHADHLFPNATYFIPQE